LVKIEGDTAGFICMRCGTIFYDCIQRDKPQNVVWDKKVPLWVLTRY